MNGLTFGKNISALRAERRLNAVSGEISTAFQRLSSGQRINRPSDDPAGLGIASILTAQRKILSQGVRNLNDGVSALNIADGSMAELSSLVERQRELATQAANGSLSTAQRNSLNVEFQALAQEHARIISTSSFNGNYVINGSSSNLNLQGGGSTLRLNVLNTASTAQGAGTYTPQASYTGGAGPGGEYQLLVADVNGDTIDDLIAVAVEAVGPFDFMFTAHTVLGGSYAVQTTTEIESVTDGSTISNFAIGKSGKSVFVSAMDGGGSTVGGTFTLDAGGGLGGYVSTGATSPDLGSQVVAGDFNGDGITDLGDAAGGTEFTLYTQNVTYIAAIESLSQSALAVNSIASAQAAIIPAS